MLLRQNKIIFITPGKGGNGSKSCLLFSKKKLYYDGGNGGDGGNVILQYSTNITLKNLINKNYKAEDGYNGARNKRSGRRGKDLIIPISQSAIIQIFHYTDKYAREQEINMENKSIKFSGGKGGFGTITTKNVEYNNLGEEVIPIKIKIENIIINRINIVFNHSYEVNLKIVKQIFNINADNIDYNKYNIVSIKNNNFIIFFHIGKKIINEIEENQNNIYIGKKEYNFPFKNIFPIIIESEEFAIIFNSLNKFF